MEKNVALVMMVSNILGHSILPQPFPTITIATTIIVTVTDNNAFDFNKCNLENISGFKKKTNNFSNFVK